MRTLALIGRLSPRGALLSRRCAWCRRFYRIRDRLFAALGSPLTHGCCDSCLRKLLEEA